MEETLHKLKKLGQHYCRLVKDELLLLQKKKNYYVPI